MFESPLFLPIALGLLAVLQLATLVGLLRLSGRVSQLFRTIASQVPAESQELADRKEANSDQKRLFAEFLAENPARKDLLKREQFAAFRQWREDKGLNWKGSE